MNKQKTEAMWLGENKPPDISNDIKWTEDPIKCLGIYFGKNKMLVEDLNWKPKLSKLEKVLNCWKSRNLTYYGKITIIKTLGLSQILFNASVISVPDYIVRVVNKHIFNFLWGSGREKVKRTTITSNMNQGGLNARRQ